MSDDPDKRAPLLLVAVPVAAIAVLALLAFHRHQRRVIEDAPAPVAASLPSPAPAIDQAPASDEQAQAACHPHLTSGPDTVPQVSTANVPDPRRAHMKIRFRVDGSSGTVARQELVSADFGSPLEQATELAFVRQLVFAVPDIPDCRQRQIEGVADVFEAGNPAAGWATLVKVHPRYSFDARGALQAAD